MADAAVEAVGNGLVEGGAVQGVGFAPGADVLAELVEGVVNAVVGGDDAHFAAPDEQRHRRFQELVELVMEGGFVEDNQPLFAAQV